MSVVYNNPDTSFTNDEENPNQDNLENINTHLKAGFDGINGVQNCLYHHTCCGSRHGSHWFLTHASVNFYTEKASDLIHCA
jgi:hypothetical protein